MFHLNHVSESSHLAESSSNEASACSGHRIFMYLPLKCRHIECRWNAKVRISRSGSAWPIWPSWPCALLELVEDDRFKQSCGAPRTGAMDTIEHMGVVGLWIPMSCMVRASTSLTWTSDIFEAQSTESTLSQVVFKGLRNGLAQGFPSVTIPRVLNTCQTSLAGGFCHNLCHFFLILLLFLIIFVNDAIDTIVHHTPVLQCFGWSGTCSSSSKGWHNARNRVVAMVAFGFACFAGVARCGGNYIGCFGGATSYIGYIGCVSFKSCFHSLWSFGLFNATSVWSTLWSTSTDRTPGCPWLWAAWWFRRTWRSLLCLIERCDWCDACHTPRTRMPWSNCHARNRLGWCCLRIAKAHLADLAYQPLVTHSWDVLHHTQIQRSRTDFRLEVLLWW